MSENTTNTTTSEPIAEAVEAEAQESAPIEAEASPVKDGEAESSPEAGVEAQDATEGPRKYTVKIDGEEIEVDETELLRGYQLRTASDKKFREASYARKQADALIELLREDPIKALTHPSVGVDFRQLAEKFLADAIEDEMATPEEREKRQKLQRLEELERENAQFKKSEEERQMAQMTAHYRQEYENNIINALDKSGLPKTNHTVKRMAYYMAQALENGYELQPVDVVDLVRKDYQSEIKDLLGASDERVLFDLIGDDIAGKIRKHDIAKLKKSALPVAESTGEVRTPREASKQMSMDDFSAYLKSIKD